MALTEQRRFPPACPVLFAGLHAAHGGGFNELRSANIDYLQLRLPVRRFGCEGILSKRTLSLGTIRQLA